MATHPTHRLPRLVAAPFARYARLAGHVAFWLLALAFYTIYFGQRESTYGQSLIFVGLLLPITIATTYFLNYWLIPRYLLTRRYALFALYFSYTLVFSVYLELVLVTIMFVTVANFRELFILPNIVEFLNVLVGMYLVVFVGVALHLLKRWYSVRESNLDLDRKRLEAELKLKEAELKLLKSQIHPHFLFNTLNNLYGLTLEDSENAPDVVLRISSMLDYMLYRGNQDRVPLNEEIEYVQNYLSLEKLRYTNRIRVEFEVEGPVEHCRVAPLLLIPFVENGFKHGVNRSIDEGDILIRLSVSNGDLRFSVDNSKGSIAASKDDSSLSEGIGLENVKKRLSLLYENQHALDIRETDDRFRIDLEIHLDETNENTLSDR